MFASSLHASLVHERPSLQTRGAPMQAADVSHASFAVQNEPSSQLAPSFELQTADPRVGSQIWQRLAAFVAPAA